MKWSAKLYACKCRVSGFFSHLYFTHCTKNMGLQNYSLECLPRNLLNKWSVRRSWMQVLVVVGCDWARPCLSCFSAVWLLNSGDFFLAFSPRSALNLAGIKGEKEARLDGALMVAALSMQGSALGALWGPFQLQPFCETAWLPLLGEKGMSGKVLHISLLKSLN